MWKWSGASLLIRSECLLLLIIIIIIIIIFYREGIEYRIYSIDRERRERGCNKCNKSCPEYSKVLHERDFWNSLPNQGQDLLHLLHAWVVCPENSCWKWKPKRIIIWKQISSHIIKPKVRKWWSWWNRKCLDKNKT